jgi:hypothetical protein
MDYNISFKSVNASCTNDMKIESRRIWVEVQSRLIELLTLFVTENSKNQALVFTQLEVKCELIIQKKKKKEI